MRKIEQWMINAVKVQQHLFKINPQATQKEQASNGNTRVTTVKREDGAIITSVYLHDNLIAQNSLDGSWGFNFCGWPTPTTRGRINALCKEFGYVGVNQVKGKQWCGSTEVYAYAWFNPRKTSA